MCVFLHLIQGTLYLFDIFTLSQAKRNSLEVSIQNPKLEHKKVGSLSVRLLNIICSHYSYIIHGQTQKACQPTSFLYLIKEPVRKGKKILG